MLSKSTALVIAMAGIGASWHLARRNRSNPAAPFIVAGVMFCICGLWLVRNTILYGDPLGARIFDEAFASSPSRKEFVQAATGATGFAYLRAWLTIAFATCWGFFGGPNTAIAMLNPFGSRGPRFEAFSVLPLMIFPFATTIVAIFGTVKWKLREWKNPVLPMLPKIALIWWSLAFFGVVLVLWRFNLTYFQAQARYLHPAFLPMCLIFALGWRTIFGAGRALKIFSFGFGGVLLLITLWNVFGWKTLV